MKKQRTTRVGEMIQHILGEAIRGQLTDPRIGFTSVTRVDLSPDLQNCKVFVSTLGDEKTQVESLEVLQRAAGFLRHQLAREMELRRVPELFFYKDKALHEAEHIFEIIEKIKRGKPDSDDEDNI